MVIYHRVCNVRHTVVTGRPDAIAATLGQSANARHGHDTRRASEITLPRIRTEVGRRRLCYGGVQGYNQLPAIDTTMSFRRQLKQHILQLRNA